MLSAEEIRELSPPIPDNFQGFDPRAPVTIYRRNLPHWRQEGATYFVTFRLADSIPREVWKKVAEEVKWWQRKFDQEGSLSEAQGRDFEQFQKRQRKNLETTLDQCHGDCPLSEAEHFEIVERALHYFDRERYSLYSYVVMPNHCHVLLCPYAGYDLETILQSWKAHTARKISHQQNPFWHRESHDRIVRDADHYRKTAKYMLKNPIRARLGSEFTPLYLHGVLEERGDQLGKQ